MPCLAGSPILSITCSKLMIYINTSTPQTPHAPPISLPEYKRIKLSLNNESLLIHILKIHYLCIKSLLFRREQTFSSVFAALFEVISDGAQLGVLAAAVLNWKMDKKKVHDH